MLCVLNRLMRLLNLMLANVGCFCRCVNLLKSNKEQERAATISLNFHIASMTSFDSRGK